jgi:hypothetical protein
MATGHRRIQGFGRIGAVVLATLLAASSALAFGNQGDGGLRDRLLRIRAMDMLVINYGSTNWYGVTSSLAANPAAPDNAPVMSVFLSIGNVHLNRFEKDGDPAHLARALLFFEWVVANHSLWGERQGSGSVVSYLDISVARLQKECDVGEYGVRIDALANMAKAITAEEADILFASKSMESISPVVDSSRISLLAAAANFLKDDLRAGAWGQSAESLAAELRSSDCGTLESAMDLSLGALSYRLAGQPVPQGFSDVTSYGEFRPAGCPGIIQGYATSAPVSVVTPGASLDAAIRDAQIVAIYVEEYLWFYQPGRFCGPILPPDDNPIDKNR